MDNASRKRLKDSLNRIQGHVRGIRKMLLEGRCYTDIIVQLSAVKVAIKQAELQSVKEYFRAKDFRSEKNKQALKEMLGCILKEVE